MKAFRRALALALMIAPAASYATKIPIPIDGATLNVSVQFQPEVQINGGAAPAGTSPSYDIFIRRERLLVNGDISSNFQYLLQLDNANFGKFGNFSFRGIVQDAWVGWAPTGSTGGTVVFIDAGLLLEPLSHNYLESTTNFITADITADPFRLAGNPYQGLRSTGVQTRGWALDKKIGWRGGVYEGVTPFDPQTFAAGTLGVNSGGSVTGVVPTGGAACTATGKGAGTCLTPKRSPQFAGFVNFDIIGSEEGGWLYGAYKWGDQMILSVGAAGYYQSLATKNAFGNLTDTKIGSIDAYLNMPFGNNELVAEFTYYGSGNGTGSANTGMGFSAQAGVRIAWIAPYVAYEYFNASSCPSEGGDYTAAQVTACNAQGGGVGTATANSRNFRAGLNFFANKNFNHVNLEFQVNHGSSTYGAQSETVANSGYVPNINDGKPANTLLASAATYSLLMHWNVFF